MTQATVGFLDANGHWVPVQDGVSALPTSDVTGLQDIINDLTFRIEALENPPESPAGAYGGSIVVPDETEPEDPEV